MDDVRPGRSTAFAAVLLVAVVGGTVLGTRGDAARRDPIAAAVDSVPLVSGTVDVTVWSRVRGSVDAAGLRDVTTRSVLATIADETRTLLGWTPADLDWEVHTTLPSGTVVVLALGDVDDRTVRRGLDDAGDRTGSSTWTVATGGTDFRAVFESARLLPARRLLVAGAPEAVTEAVAVIEGRADSAIDDRSAADLVRTLGDAASVILRSREVACFDALDPEVAAAVRDRVGDALVDPRWTARALTDARVQRIAFAAAFDSPQQARSQLAARRALTDGSFIGRGGQVSESLEDLRASAQGAVASLDFALTPRAEPFMTDTGPVVFSGCAAPSPA